MGSISCGNEGIGGVMFTGGCTGRVGVGGIFCCGGSEGGRIFVTGGCGGSCGCTISI